MNFKEVIIGTYKDGNVVDGLPIEEVKKFCFGKEIIDGALVGIKNIWVLVKSGLIWKNAVLGYMLLMGGAN